MNHVVFFDGVCNLCNSSVQKLIELDKEVVLSFASLQSDLGQKILKDHQMNTQKLDSILYLRDDTVYEKSTAFLKIMQDIMPKNKLLMGLEVLPLFIRDSLYNLVAKNRYLLFGKQESCWVPTPSLQKRFLNDNV